MGELVETGPKSTLKKGERVVVPFTIAWLSLLSPGLHPFFAAADRC
jgi:hypothetical protein